MAVLLAAGFLSIVATPASAAVASKSLTLDVYSDGYVHVTQVVSVSQEATSIQVPLLSAKISGLVATDQKGSPLSYDPNSGGGNITVYTLGATTVNLSYDTGDLTTYSGTVWTLSYAARYNSTVVLPQLSTLLSASGTPYSVKENDSSPVLAVPPGPWKVTYGVPLEGATTSSSTTPSGGPPGSASALTEEVALVAVVAVAAGLLFWWWRRRSVGPRSGDLRADDLQVLNFIQERGGKVLELEIRTRFALPKTSAWRQIKRLERLGYVKVTKIGSQNQIEIRKDRGAGA